MQGILLKDTWNNYLTVLIKFEPFANNKFYLGNFGIIFKTKILKLVSCLQKVKSLRVFIYFFSSMTGQRSCETSACLAYSD